MQIINVYFFIFTFFLFSCKPNVHRKSFYEKQDLSFAVNGGKTILNGELDIPDDFQADGKLVILVSPPEPINRDYLGFYKVIADSLSNNGIAVFRFDNRASRDSSQVNSTDMFTQAEDVHDAIAAIRKIKRFSKVDIGLSGHSEGGNSAVIEAGKYY